MWVMDRVANKAQRSPAIWRDRRISVLRRLNVRGRKPFPELNFPANFPLTRFFYCQSNNVMIRL